MARDLVDVFSVIEHGGIVAFSRELNAIVTSDGNLFILWLGVGTRWKQCDVKVIKGDAHKLGVISDLILKAELYLAEFEVKGAA